MGSFGKIRDLVTKNKTLHYYAKCVYYKRIDAEFFEFMLSNKKIILPMESYGKYNFGKSIYNISLHLPNVGLCVIIREALAGLQFCSQIGAIPYLEIDPDNLYYDEAMDTDSIFNYYFEPISQIERDEVYQSCCVINSTARQRRSIYNCEFQRSNYMLGDDAYKNLAPAYKKYFRLKASSWEYIDSTVFRTCGMGKTLGVHVRGTDMLKECNGHPVTVPLSEYISECIGAMNTHSFENIFLATDDARILEVFKREFSNKLLYYEDTLRSEDGGALHYEVKCERPKHRYMLGLEVLRDVYTLAACSGFVSGLSNIPHIVVALKESQEETFIYRKELSAGITDNMRIFGVNSTKRR